MDHGFVGLCSEDVCAGNGEAGGFGGGFFEGGVDGVGGVQGVGVDSDVFCDCGVGCLWLRQNRCDEILGEGHGGDFGRVREVTGGFGFRSRSWAGCEVGKLLAASRKVWERQ